jgi:hypothetical protein
MELCWPNRAKEINWNKKPKFLDKELIKITKDAATGNKFVDKLVEVELIDGNHCAILLHIEVQSTKQDDFSKRMFVYRYRLRDVYSQPIASLAVLIDNDPNWRPCTYNEHIWDSEINMKFPIIKIIDYNEKIQELEQSTNPFAIIVLAQLSALKKQDNELKLSNKIQITRKLGTLGLHKEDIFYLFKFIDWIIMLPEPYEEQYMRAVTKNEEFNFTSPAEKIWLKQGEIKGKTKVALFMLNKKLPLKLITEATGLSVEELQKLKPQHKINTKKVQKTKLKLHKSTKKEIN